MNGREDEIILCVLSGQGAATAAPANEEEATLRRLYTEVLGLVPLALEPVEPRPEVRARLLQAIRGAAAAGPGRGGRGAPEPLPEETEEATRPGLLAFEEATRPGLVPFEAPRPAPVAAVEPGPALARRRGRRWPLALAAGVALLATGLAGFLFARLEDSRAELVRTGSSLRALAAREAERSADLAALRGELEQATGKLGLLAGAGTEACPMRPPGGPGLARGVVFIAADHQHWLLRVAGLPPLAADRAYQLWFVTDQGPVSAGTFRTAAGADAELGSPSMPGGITAFAVTVEPAGGSAAPTGEPVLFGDQPARLL